MKRILSIIISVFLPVLFWGLDCRLPKEWSNADFDVSYVYLSEYQKDKPQRHRFLTLREYKSKDYFYIRKVSLPEYELYDNSMTDLILRFIEAEKHQQYYDSEGYILLCKETPDIWTFMSIFPNEYSFSYYGYGSYDGVIHFCDHTFILSLRNYDSHPFIETGKRESVQFLELKDELDIWELVFTVMYEVPDPYEDDYPIWRVRYDKDHYELMEKPGVIYRFPSSEILPKIDFELNPKAESNAMIEEHAAYLGQAGAGVRPVRHRPARLRRALLRPLYSPLDDSRPDGRENIAAVHKIHAYSGDIVGFLPICLR